MERVLEHAAANMKKAQVKLATAPREERDLVLSKVADLLEQRADEIYAANAIDIEKAEQDQVAAPLLKRLKFDEDKLTGSLVGIRQIIDLPDPNQKVIEARELDEGLILKRVSCPIGVIGMIFESRPDALIQIAALCLKSGNGILLKGGSEALNTNRILTDIFIEATESLKFELIDPEWIYLLESREEVREMLSLDHSIDLIIPRGSNSFVKYIMQNTTIPVLGHADGITHSYIDCEADIIKAVSITVDAKCQYPAVCNALETLLVHKDIAEAFLPKLASELEKRNVEIRSDEAARSLIGGKEATEEDWKSEYLDYILSIRVVADMKEAIDHIHTYGSGHTDSIITESVERAEYFLNAVDSADVMWNCSTRFSDGFRYGLGAEVGISTLKIHARGPVGLEGLMSYKWKLYGNGHIVSDYAGKNAKSFTHRNLSHE